MQRGTSNFNCMNKSFSKRHILIISAVLLCLAGAIILGVTLCGRNSGAYELFFKSSPEHTDIEKVRAYLGSLPEDYSELAGLEVVLASDILRTLAGDADKSEQLWNDFADKVNAGSEAMLTAACYTDEGDPIFYYIYYDTERFWYSWDNTRDRFGVLQEITLTPYKYLSVSEEAAYIELLLSDREGLTFDVFSDMIYDESGKYDVELENIACISIEAGAGWKAINRTGK